MAGSVEQAGGQLASVAEQQSSLAAAVAAGELWLDSGVAERAAARCEQAVREIDQWLSGADRLTQRRKFGDNHDGQVAAARFVKAGQEFVDSMKGAQEVFKKMAATYRAAGRTVSETDAANEQMFRSRSE